MQIFKTLIYLNNGNIIELFSIDIIPLLLITLFVTFVPILLPEIVILLYPYIYSSYLDFSQLSMLVGF